MATKPTPKVFVFPRRAKHARHAPWRAALGALDARIAGIERRLMGRGYGAGPAVSARMRTALIASLLVHLFLVYGVAFKLPARPDFNDLNQQLEVVLVNAKSKTRPVKADALAQHNLDGGGNTDEKRQAQTPLPSMKPEEKPENDVKLALRKVEKLEREARQLMTRKQSAPVVETEVTAPKAETPVEAEPRPTLQASDLMQRSLELARLDAKIERDYAAIQQRPRRRFVGARTQEFRFARYIEDWRQKIERVGELNYPQAARDQKLSGYVLVTVAVKADGSVEQVSIDRPSGNKVLDEAARRIVQLAAPFPAFPANIAKDIDILHITRTWTFTTADRFLAQ